MRAQGTGENSGQKRVACPAITSPPCAPALSARGGWQLLWSPAWALTSPNLAQLLEWPRCLGFRVRPRTAGLGEDGGPQGASPWSPYVAHPAGPQASKVSCPSLGWGHRGSPSFPPWSPALWCLLPEAETHPSPPHPRAASCHWPEPGTPPAAHP